MPNILKKVLIRRDRTMPWSLMGILFIVAAVLCCMGFYKFVYFLSVGYGLAVCGLGIAMAVFGATGVTSMNMIGYIFCVLFVIYGIRLSGFLIVREIKNLAYRKTLDEATKAEKAMPVFVKAIIWLCVSILYVAQVSPILFRSISDKADSAQIIGIVGIAISVIGVILETIADKQKSAQKAVNPNMVATKGLYKFVRCPNYFGEILFWTGVLVSGVTVYSGVGQWLCAGISYICIVYIMFNGAQRLEKRQNGRYGEVDEYKKYVNKTPVIIPFLPIYHLNKK